MINNPKLLLNFFSFFFISRFEHRKYPNKGEKKTNKQGAKFTKLFTLVTSLHTDNFATRFVLERGTFAVVFPKLPRYNFLDYFELFI
jgi:hypothetical protein